MPINILGESRYPEGYRRGPGLDSKGRAGPTLQRIADEHKTRKNNASLLEAAFENLAPLGMYSGDAEAIHLPSKTMTNAKTLASLFQDWFKGGTPTINVPFDTWPEIIKSGKFKNQMELAGKFNPEAWKQRIEVEKKLGGFPYPRELIINKDDKLLEYYKSYAKHLENNQTTSGNKDDLLTVQQMMRELEDRRGKPEYSESLAKKNPVYGHIYNKKYNEHWNATGFGDTHAEMSDLIKEQSKYVLGDSFAPMIKTAFSSDDMLGNTSRLERALFNPHRKDWMVDNIRTNPGSAIPYMEMWVPNHLARLNNVKSVHLPKYDSALPVKKVIGTDKAALRNNTMQRDMDELYYQSFYDDPAMKQIIDDEIPF